MRLLVVLAHEALHAGEIVEPHQGHELNVVVSLAAHQVYGPERGNAARFATRNDLAAHDALVRLRVVLGRPASPHPADHEPDTTCACGCRDRPETEIGKPCGPVLLPLSRRGASLPQVRMAGTN